MRFFWGLTVLILVQTAVFAQVPQSSGASSLSLKTIDSLNRLSLKIYLENPDSARVLGEKALILAEKAKYPKGIAESFFDIGHVYWSQSYYPIALMYFNRALTSFAKDDRVSIARCYTIMGRTYADLKNFGKAMGYFEKARQYAEGRADLIADVYSERSLVFRRQGKYTEALAEAQKALVLNRQVKDVANTAVLYGRMSGIYTVTRRYKEALAYSDTAYAMSFITHNRRLRATTDVEYARINNELKNYDRAILFAKRGGDLADSIGVVDAISDAYKAMITSYEGKGDIKTAMLFQKRYNKMQDSLNTFNKNKNTELIQDYFALDKRLSDLAEMERSAGQNKALVKSQRAAIITLGVSLAVVIALLFITYYFYKQRKRANDQLRVQHGELLKQKQLIEAQTANLEMVASVKDKLLAVIAHDLRTPLANLRNITDMFDTDYLSKEEVHALMKDINPLVKSAELTLSNLLEWAGSNIKGRNVNASRLDIFLLGVEMEQIFGHALQKKNIEYRNQASPGQSVLADENHIKVVLRNLISNAIKFTETNGRVILSSSIDDDKMVVCVEDNGMGMSVEDISKLFTLKTHFSQRGTLGESGTGIGLMLCKELIEINGGRLWIESKPGKGSKFYFSLPLNAEYA